MAQNGELNKRCARNLSNYLVFSQFARKFALGGLVCLSFADACVDECTHKNGECCFLWCVTDVVNLLVVEPFPPIAVTDLLLKERCCQ